MAGRRAWIGAALLLALVAFPPIASAQPIQPCVSRTWNAPAGDTIRPVIDEHSARISVSAQYPCSAGQGQCPGAEEPVRFDLTASADVRRQLNWSLEPNPATANRSGTAPVFTFQAVTELKFHLESNATLGRSFDVTVTATCRIGRATVMRTFIVGSYLNVEARIASTSVRPDRVDWVMAFENHGNTPATVVSDSMPTGRRWSFEPVRLPAPSEGDPVPTRFSNLSVAGENLPPAFTLRFRFIPPPPNGVPDQSTSIDVTVARFEGRSTPVPSVLGLVAVGLAAAWGRRPR